MLRSIVDTVPTGLLVVVVVGFVLGSVLLGVWAVRRFVPSTRDGFDAEVSSQMMGVVASLFGLLLAFVVVIEFQAFSSAGDNVQSEADDLGAIARDSYAFGPAGAKIRTAIGSYVTLVVDDEWPLMRDGKESARAWQGIDGIFTEMQAYRPVSTSEVAFYDDSVRHLNAVLEARSNRLDASSGNDLPVLIAALILVGAIVILGYATLVGSTSSAFHAIGAGAIAIVVGFALVVLVALQFPFSGGLAVDSQPFREGALAPFFTSK
jgi:ABC-type multidrug transport system fused ATPase/permease subunit